MSASENSPRDNPLTRTKTLGAWVWPSAVGLIVSAAYVIFAYWQWTHFAVKSWDLGIFTTLLKQYASWQAPIVAIKGDGFNLLGDHFHPLLVFLAPIYGAFPSAYTLLAIQAVCFGVAAGILTYCARNYLGPVIGVLLGLGFGFSWGLQYAAEAQFHEIALAVPLLSAALCALVSRRWRIVLICAGLLVFVKEDLGFTVAAVGAVLAWRSRNPQHLWLVVWGIGWFAIATFVVLPLLNPNGAWAYGSNIDLLGTLTNPEILFDSRKLQTTMLLIALSAGIALRSPLILVALPTVAWRFLSSNEGHWGPTWHYSAVLMPIVFFALIDGVRLAKASRRRWFREYARYAVAVNIVVSALILPALPLASILAPASWEPGARAGAARQAIAAVPAGASVETDIGLMSYLVDEHEVFWVGNSNPPAECILVDLDAGGIPDEWGKVQEIAKVLHPELRYQVLYDDSGYQLACQDAQDG